MLFRSNLITLFVIFFHAIILPDYRFFFPRFLLSRKYKIQIAARVGRKSAVALSGTTEASCPLFFIGQGFESRRALLENVKLGKFVPIRLRSPREWKNRTRLDEYYFFYYLIPPEDDFWKKNMYSCEQVVNCEYNYDYD